MTITAIAPMTARKYATMTEQEKVAYDIDLLNNPMTKAGKRKLARGRLETKLQSSAEWCIAAIDQVDDYEEGTREHEFLLTLAKKHQEVCETIMEAIGI